MTPGQKKWWRRLRRDYHRQAFGEELARLDFAPLQARLRYVHQRQLAFDTPGDKVHPAEYGNWQAEFSAEATAIRVRRPKKAGRRR